MNRATLNARNKLCDDMDGAAYECAGVLQGILLLYDNGQLLPLPANVVARMRRQVEHLAVLTAEFHAINATDTARGRDDD